MEYPEHEKVQACQGESNTIGQFLEWMNERNIVLCSEFKIHLEDLEWECGFAPLGVTTEQILADYFDVDLDALRDEKDQMFEELRKMNQTA